ncbi:hypothetical protein [Erysipelothrix rhusiopathiae]|uniref:hypothetical protein n=1 Tax=Erysipelothrix rhusiopathiae TaxID=1648 RepID=UPI0039F03580
MSKHGSLSDKDKKIKVFAEAKKNRELSEKFLSETGRNTNAFMIARWNSESDPTSTEFDDLKKEFEQWKKNYNIN